jgi:hypothetical protein
MRSVRTVAMLSLQFGPCRRLRQWYVPDSAVVRTPVLLDRPYRYVCINIYMTSIYLILSRANVIQ